MDSIGTLGVTGGYVGPPRTEEETKEFFLAMLRGVTDERTIAEEAYKYLVARDGRRVSRDVRIAAIARWLNMDGERLRNWLNRAKPAR